MTYKVYQADRFREQIADQIDWFVQTGQVMSAAKLLEGLEELQEILATNPSQYMPLRGLPKRKGLIFRKAKLKWFIIAYQVEEAKAEVILLSFRHERSDPQRQIDDV